MAQSILKGDYQKFDQIISKYENLVKSQVVRYTNSEEELEDLVQDIFIQVFESLSKYRGESSLSSWIYKIASNKIKMKFRKKTISASDFSEELNIGSKNSSPEVQIIESEFKSKISHFISKLPKSYSDVLKMYYFENMSYNEISEKLNIKLNTLKSNLLRAKEILKRSIENYEKS